MFYTPKEIVEEFDIKMKTSIEEALTFLYVQIIKLKDHQAEEFIRIVKINDMESNGIVTMLNALSPVKTKLEYWDEFVGKCHRKLNMLVGSDKADKLMKVIV